VSKYVIIMMIIINYLEKDMMNKKAIKILKYFFKQGIKILQRVMSTAEFWRFKFLWVGRGYWKVGDS